MTDCAKARLGSRFPATCGRCNEPATCVHPWCAVPKHPAAPDVSPLPKPGVLMVRGYACTMVLDPSESELRAMAHALTVQADRMACARQRQGDNDG